jgi:hypothetical protein
MGDSNRYALQNLSFSVGFNNLGCAIWRQVLASEQFANFSTDYRLRRDKLKQGH